MYLFLGKKHACMLITSGQKNTNFVEDVEYLPPVKVRWIQFQIRSRKFLSKSEAWRPSWFSNQQKKQTLGRGGCDFASCQVSLNSIQRLYLGVENVSVNQRLGWQSWFSIFRDVNFGYMCPMTLTLEIWPWSSSCITLGSWWILWNNIQI